MTSGFPAVVSAGKAGFVRIRLRSECGVESDRLLRTPSSGIRHPAGRLHGGRFVCGDRRKRSGSTGRPWRGRFVLDLRGRGVHGFLMAPDHGRQIQPVSRLRVGTEGRWDLLTSGIDLNTCGGLLRVPLARTVTRRVGGRLPGARVWVDVHSNVHLPALRGNK